MNKTLHFAELQPGRRWTSAGRTLTEAELALFAALTGDRHPIHADAEYARGTRFGQRLFHGTFGLALAVAMSTELPQLHEPVLAATGFEGWKFLAPLFIGDTVRVEVELTGARTSADGATGVLQRRLVLRKQDGTAAQEGTAGLLVRLRS